MKNNSLNIQVVEQLYSDTLQHKVNSEDFRKNSNVLSKLYRDTFGMTSTWLEYHKTEKEYRLLELFAEMKNSLIKHYNL